MLLHNDNQSLINEYERITSLTFPSHRDKFYTEDKEAIAKIKREIRQNSEVIELIENYYGLLYGKL